MLIKIIIIVIAIKLILYEYLIGSGILADKKWILPHKKSILPH